MSDKDWRANSRFDGLSLGANAAVHLVRVLDPTVVASENEEGVFVKIFLFQIVNDLAAAFVQPLDIGPVASRRFVRGDVFVFVKQSIIRSRKAVETDLDSAALRWMPLGSTGSLPRIPI